MQIAYVNLFVSDLERALAFYQGTLGLALEHAAPEHGYASLAAGPIRLGLAVAGPEQRELVGRHTGIGFAVPDLAAEHDRLAGLGVRFPMPPARQPGAASWRSPRTRTGTSSTSTRSRSRTGEIRDLRQGLTHARAADAVDGAKRLPHCRGEKGSLPRALDPALSRLFTCR